MQGRRLLGTGLLVALAAAAGCSRPAGDIPLSVAAAPHPEASHRFDASAAGDVAGRVEWTGPVPHVEPFISPSRPTVPAYTYEIGRWTNPHTPQVLPGTAGLAQAVVFLRGIDPARARPWSHPPVAVDQRARRYHVQQGSAKSLYGFVRRGDAIELRSAGDDFYVTQARGAAFFSVPFADAGQLTRRLNHTGHVELISGAARYWMRAHLFVDDHPYFALSDGEGQFRLAEVPEGDYELVCWVPNWNVARRQTDPNTGFTGRVEFHPPVEVVRRVTIRRGQTTTQTFTLRVEDFNPPSQK